MYEPFYGFREKPFSIIANPKYLYLSDKHRNALTYLEYAIREGEGYILLTGEIGAGKTTLLRHVLRGMAPRIDVAVVFNTHLTAEQLLRLILTEFDLAAGLDPGDKVAAIEALYAYASRRYREGRRVLIIIDEAQNLSTEVLEELRMLSNFQSDDAVLLQLMLVGQPELRARLGKPDLAQIAQRIGMTYHLGALTREETGLYVDHRLKTAGGSEGLFTGEAIETVYNAAGGIPRSINLLCDAALVYGFADERERIEKEVVEEVLRTNGGLGLEAAGRQKRGDGQPEASASATPERLAALEARVEALREDVERRLDDLANRVDGGWGRLVGELENRLAEEKKRYGRLREIYRCLERRCENVAKNR